MKLAVFFDLLNDTIVLETKFSHREFSAKRALTCRECGTMNRNHLVEALRAIALYEQLPYKNLDVSDAILAYNLQEILGALGDKPVRHYTERGREVGNGCRVRFIPRKLTLEEIGDLDELV